MSVNKKEKFYCSNCGAIFSKWLGQCVECKEWNKIVNFNDFSNLKQKNYLEKM